MRAGKTPRAKRSMKMADTKQVYQTAIKAFDEINWHYNRDDENQIITCNVSGEDLTIKIFYRVCTDRNIMYVKSAMPFTVNEKKRMELCVAVAIANFTMLNGSFELDISDGYLGFKILCPFMDMTPTTEVCKYLINLTCRMTDIYNDKFLAVANGTMTLNQFKEFADNAVS